MLTDHLIQSCGHRGGGFLDSGIRQPRLLGRRITTALAYGMAWASVAWIVGSAHREHQPLTPVASTVPTSGAAVTVLVDTTADRRPISPYIYGVAHAPADILRELRIGSHRWGGNPNTRHNWEINAWNSARDWEWRNHHGDKPWKRPSEAADEFVRSSREAGAAVLLTVPTIGWVARDGNNDSRSLDVPVQGGPPLRDADGPIAGYDPTENRRRTSIRSVARKGKPFADSPDLKDDVVYQDEWIHHLVRTFGKGADGGVRFFAMDNEADLWDGTHTDVHPAQMGYDDLLSRFLEYASAVKDVDPSAQVTGPASWGWIGYQYSPLDRGNDLFQTAGDRKRHGGEPFLLWFMKQVRAHDERTGKRSLDVLDVHLYPQGSGVHAGKTDEATQALRLRSVRALWDPAYVDESWIAQPVRLIPRLNEWIAAGYPGTRIGITEWNFGADTEINGALAIAEALGIYGREGVYLANYWTHPAKNTPGYLTFKLYRNADGEGHGFGDTACRATTNQPDRVGCYASVDSSTRDVTLILTNKMPETTASVSIKTGIPASKGTVRSWQLSKAEPRSIRTLDGVPVSAGELAVQLPPYSITLLRFPGEKR